MHRFAWDRTPVLALTHCVVRGIFVPFLILSVSSSVKWGRSYLLEGVIGRMKRDDVWKISLIYQIMCDLQRTIHLTFPGVMAHFGEYPQGTPKSSLALGGRKHPNSNGFINPEV